MTLTVKRIIFSVLIALAFFFDARVFGPVLLYKMHINLLHVHLAYLVLLPVIALLAYKRYRPLACGALLYLVFIIYITVSVSAGYADISSGLFKMTGNSKLKDEDYINKISYFVNSMRLTFDVKNDDITAFERHYDNIYDYERTSQPVPKNVLLGMKSSATVIAAGSFFPPEDVASINLNAPKFCRTFFDRACDNKELSENTCKTVDPCKAKKE
jgi:hypothetical protein